MKEVNKREERCGYTQQQTAATDLQLNESNDQTERPTASRLRLTTLPQFFKQGDINQARARGHIPTTLPLLCIAPPTLGTIDPEA